MRSYFQFIVFRDVSELNVFSEQAIPIFVNKLNIPFRSSLMKRAKPRKSTFES